MFDDAAKFLNCSGEEAGDINKGNEGNIKAIAESDEPRGFNGGVDVESSG